MDWRLGTEAVDYAVKEQTRVKEINRVAAPDETARIAKGIFGEKLYQERARAALPILVRQATAQQKIKYGDLAEEVGMPNAAI